MPSHSPFRVHHLQASVHFIQGYRYLDRCGEALIKLENILEKGWLPSETTPKAGSLKNDQLGLTASFNSEALTVSQIEFISFEHFFDQACKIFETLVRTFEIKEINLPSIKVVFQKGFKDDEVEEASQHLIKMRLCTPNGGLVALLGGKPEALEFVLVTAEDLEWNQERVHQRRRMQSQVIRQERQPPFDERLLRRARQLGKQQRAAIAALMQLRRQVPEIFPVAVQLDLEHSFETEFGAEAFDLPAFLEQGWTWAESVSSGLTRLEGEKK
ncbi:MAG: hypothetical protein HYS12_18965 [Planctomycetes bacterium]|nr:hypothetical protein [Planctomycetota bacterium]